MSAILETTDPEIVGLSSAGLAQVDAMIAEQIDAKQLAGAVVLVARRGKVAHFEAMGLKNLAAGEPLAKDSIFAIFSMTKPITAAAMMVLYDRGLW